MTVRYLGPASLPVASLSLLVLQGCAFDEPKTDEPRACRSVVDESGAVPAPRRPNIVMLLTDDQRWDAIGVVQREMGAAGRFPFFRDQTPNMDRIAAEGVRFRNAFVAFSLCSPSRATFLTGTYSHLNGVTNNHTDFPVSNVTYATLLQQAGYTTGFFGKWHMGDQYERPGFDHWASFLGQGEYLDCPLLVDSERTTETKGWIDDITTDHALDFIDRYKSGPFAMVLAFKSTHAPRVPPARLANLYSDFELPLAESALAYPPFVPKSHRVANPPTASDARDYFRVLVGVDQNVGRVLNALDQAGIADDTAVFFASDNGYLLGEHGGGVVDAHPNLDGKRTAFEESIRIAFMMRYPRLGVSGVTVDATVLNLDYAQTVLTLAGVAPPASMQGQSFLPSIGCSDTKLRDGFFYEYFYEAGEQVPPVPDITAFRTDTSKLVTYPVDASWRELYDIRGDRLELRNEAGNPQARAAETTLQAALDQAKKDVGYVRPAFADVPPP